MSDINRTGDLLFPEFALALHLCNICLSGAELPYQLEPQIKEEVSQQVDKISFSIPEDGNTAKNNTSNNGGVNDIDIFETNPVSGINTNTATHPTSYLQQPLNQPSLFSSPQRPQGSYSSPLTNQATGFGFQNNSSMQPSSFNPRGFQVQQTGYQYSQSTGYQNPTQQSAQLTPTGGDLFGQQQTSLAHQTTGFVPLKNQTGGPIQRQQTGLPAQSQLTGMGLEQATTGLIPLNQQQTGALNLQPTGLQHQNGYTQQLQQQPTGPNQGASQYTNQQTSGAVFQPLNLQPTGQAPMNQQPTGGQPLQQQATGLIPLKTSQTGNQTLKQQSAGILPVNTNPTGNLTPLKSNPTGLVPLKTDPTGQLNQQPTGLIPLNTQPTGQQPSNLIPIRTGGVQPQSTGLVPLQTGVQFEPLKQQKTGYGKNSFFLTSLVSQSSQYANSVGYLEQERITPEEKKLFNKIFDNYDTGHKGQLSADICAEIFRKSGLNREDLEKVWDLVTRAKQSHLDKESFQMGMWIVYKRLNGAEIPSELPESLKPSSVRILDDVKHKMRVQDTVKPVKKSSHSKIDGTRFKFRDDEVVTSSSRHRRRMTPSISQGEPQKENRRLSIEDMKKLINEKKILLEALDVQREESVQDEEDYERADLLAIESLKEQLKNLPQPNTSSEPAQLKARLTDLTSRVPILMDELSHVDNSITGLKLELFKIHNPSSIVGTGPNGEITDQDRRKAKSKLLLAQKMAKLTGKPIDPELERLAGDATSISEEVVNIQKESKQTQKMIQDVLASIKEMTVNVLKGLDADVNEEQYKKFELGVGVSKEVQEIVRGFKVSQITQRVIEPTQSSSQSPLASRVIFSPLERARDSPTPPQRTETERKAYIREQAKKKMEERMEKLGITRGSRAPLAVSPTVLSPVMSSTSAVRAEQHDSSSDDDDEEEFQRMELIRQRKREEREARLQGIQDEKM